LVPETLLKKRKSQEKERAEKAEARDARKKVNFPPHHCPAYYMMKLYFNFNSTSLRAVLS
jgi:hypothetical protein